jgi:membrane dipeptidase
MSEESSAIRTASPSYPSVAKEIVDVVGVDHVSIGTDQQAAPGSLQDYCQWTYLVSAMLRGGFIPAEAGKITGGNYMRIFQEAVWWHSR